jgi:hypothetical protein
LFENSAKLMHKFVPANNELFKYYLYEKCNYRKYFVRSEEENGV